MQKINILCVHRPNRSPSQRFRFEQYIEFLKNDGFDCNLSYLLNEKDDKVFYSKGKLFAKINIVIKSFFKRLGELNQIKENDIVFIQRECFMLGTSFFERLFAKSGAKVIFDFDDAIWLQNVSEANKTFVWLKNPNKTAKIITCSSLVIAGNDYLAKYALRYNRNVVIIPTTIDTNEYCKIPSPRNEKVIIGWSGSITTIQHFEYAIPFLKRIKEKFKDKVEFRVIGDASYVNEELSIKGIAWNKQTEIEDLSIFDIGIMPLPDDEWAKGKCGLKGLQYMALEIPTIMSPVGVNAEIINDGVNGFLASEHTEWVNKLSKLIESEELRKQIGIESRKTVEENYSVNANREKYLFYFNQVVSS
jgi:glycosyltransferase involved in cell wall biosynthesis